MYLCLMHYSSPTIMQGMHGDQVVVEAEVGAARDDNTAGGVRFSVCVVEVSTQPGLLGSADSTHSSCNARRLLAGVLVAVGHTQNSILLL